MHLPSINQSETGIPSNEYDLMLGRATLFDQNIWSGYLVCNMVAIQRLHSFNQPIGDWNTKSKSVAGAMFSGASSFNQRFGDWNGVSNMHYMFSQTSSSIRSGIGIPRM